MATFASMTACETRCKAQMAAKVWVVAHAARNIIGQIVARFQRYMSPSAQGAGAWIETQDDSVNRRRSSMEIEAPPNTPALDAAQAEYADIMTNPQNPRHAGLHRGDPAVSAYIDSLYKKAVPNNAPVEIGKQESVSATNDFSGDAEAQAEVETALRAEFGEAYDTTMSAMASGAKFLFEGEEGQRALSALAYRMTGLGPKAEALGVKFLADLSKLQTQGG